MEDVTSPKYTEAEEGFGDATANQQRFRNTKYDINVNGEDFESVQEGHTDQFDIKMYKRHAHTLRKSGDN